MRVDSDFIARTIAELVAINSINPAFTDGATSEAAVAARVAEISRTLDMDVRVLEFEAGRTSVVARMRGAGGGKSLMLNGHLDTVGVEEMDAPFDAQLRDGKLYGRGTYDMKGGIAACLGALKALRDQGITLRGDVVLAAVADEESESRGMQQVIDSVRTDAAIVTEATELDICIAHKGFCWLEIVTTGRAAHGSKHLEGTDANMHMGHVLHRLDALSKELLQRKPHPLTGPPTLHAPLIKGGTGISTYASECVLQVERRTIAGETEASVVAEIEAILEALRMEVPGFQATVKSFLYREPLETPRSAAIVNAVEGAARSTLGAAPRIVGQSFWMDAALLNSAGIETVVIGPVGQGAHAHDEHVDLASVVALAEILVQSAMSYCGVVR